jgi:hypothetical protein
MDISQLSRQPGKFSIFLGGIQTLLTDFKLTDHAWPRLIWAQLQRKTLRSNQQTGFN